MQQARPSMPAAAQQPTAIQQPIAAQPQPQTAAVMQPSEPESVIQQVGFRHRIGDLRARCADGTCGGTAGCQACASANCDPQGCAEVPFMPPAYGMDPQEFLCDGGDQFPKTYLRKDDTIAALDPEDTVVHYTTDAGDIEFAESNRVCVYAPRFASVRRVTGAVAGQKMVAAVGVEKPVGPVRINIEQPGLVVRDSLELGHADVAKRIDAMRDRNRGVRVEGVLQPITANDIAAAVANIRVMELTELGEAQLALLQEGATAAIAWSIEESVEVAIEDVKAPELTRDQSAEGFTRYDFGEGRLLIGKFATTRHAQPGDEIGFMLRVDNVGDGPVNHVVITDNLVTRLDYITDSDKSSVEAEFEVVENDVESSQLIWTLKEELKVGEYAILEFKCRVR